jgi:hypothetical protein
MAIRVTQACLITEAPSIAAGNIRVTQACLILEEPYFAMPIAYPLTPPAALSPQEVTMRMMNLVAETISPFSGSQQEQQWAQWWEIEVAVRPYLRVDYEAIVGFLAALNGKYGSFLFGDHNAKTPQGVATGAPTIGTGNASGSNQVITAGWSASVAGILKAGDYLQWSAVNSLGVTVQRLHKVLFDANSDAGGNATFTIFPTIREAPSSGTSIITANTAGTFRLMENASEWKIARTRVGTINFKAREVL